MKRNTVIKKLENPTTYVSHSFGGYWELEQPLKFEYISYCFEENLEDYRKRPLEPNEYLTGSRSRDHFSDFVIDAFDDKPILIYNEVGKEEFHGHVPMDMGQLALSISYKFRNIIHINKKELGSNDFYKHQYLLVKSEAYEELSRPVVFASHRFKSGYTRKKYGERPDFPSQLVIRMLDLDIMESLYNKNILFITSGFRPCIQFFNMWGVKKLVCVESYEKYTSIT